MRNQCIKFVLIVLVTLMTVSSAEEIQLSGTVKDDSTGQGISGAVVRLTGAGVSATTNAQGAFQLTGATITILRNGNISQPPYLNRSRLVFTTDKLQTFSLTIRSLNGKVIYQMQKHLGPGRYHLTPPIYKPGIHIYDIKVGQTAYVIKHVNLNKIYSTAPAFSRTDIPAGRPLARAMAVNDVLQAVHPDYISASVPVDDYMASNLEIKLKRRVPLDIGIQLPDPDNTPPATNKPVKVFILSGQSNMIGYGQIYNSTGSTRWDPNKFFVTDQAGSPTGGTVSVYEGSYSPAKDYDKISPVSTHLISALGGTNSSPFPGTGTRVLRGYLEVGETGTYKFKPGYIGSTYNIMKINGTVVHRKEPGGESVFTYIKLTQGIRHAYSIIYLTDEANGVGWIEKVDPLPGTLETLTSAAGGNKFPHLVDSDGNWTVRNDVWYKGIVSAVGNGPLAPDVWGDKFGPELQFGHIMGYLYDEPVLLIKASIGNRSLSWDVLPPGSERFNYNGSTYAGYGDSIYTWPADKSYEWARDNCEKINPNTGSCYAAWYAGKTYEEFYDGVEEVLKNFNTNFPQYKDQDEGAVYRYEFNLVNLINSLRKKFNAPNAPFVLATLAFEGWEMKDPHLSVANAQLAMNDWQKYPAFAGNVKCVEARDYWRDISLSPGTQGFHYYWNAETYFLVGNALGWAMADLLQK